MRQIASASLLMTLLITSACTQQPAPVDLKGAGNYNRSGGVDVAAGNANVTHPASPGYNPPPAYTNHRETPVSQTTEQAAGVSSIGVSDLAPPAAAKPQSKAETAQPKMAAADPVQHVNPWTRRPHFSDGDTASISPPSKQSGREPMVADMKSTDAPHHDTKAVAQLDNIIGSDAAKTAPAVKTAKAAPGGFMWPVSSHKIISGFGPKGGGKANDGINIASAGGEPVWAAADGEVVYAGNELPGYGNMVLIKHPNGKTTAYAHLGRINADKYDRVKQGEIIGYVGTSGNVKSPQLHFAIRDGNTAVDPQKYLSRSVAQN